MATFSGREAFWSGFRLIRSHPGAVLLWAAVYLGLVLLPQAAGFAWLFSDMAALAEAGEGVEPSFAQAAAMQAKIGLLQIVQLGGSLLAFVLLYGAVFRAVLTPEDHRLGYLRLGRQELWLGLVYAVAMVMVFMLALVLMMPIALIGITAGVAAAAGGAQDTSLAAGVLAGVCIVAGVGFAAWLSARVSLAFPMSFAEGKFLLFEAWPLTKGHAWKMVLVFLAVLTVFVALELLLAALVVAIAAGALASGFDAEAFFARPADVWLPQLAPLILAACVSVSLLSAAAYTLFAAPLASIYRQVTGPRAA